jgi:hypothetical protein
MVRAAECVKGALYHPGVPRIFIMCNHSWKLFVLFSDFAIYQLTLGQIVHTVPFQHVQRC